MSKLKFFYNFFAQSVISLFSTIGVYWFLMTNVRSIAAGRMGVRVFLYIAAVCVLCAIGYACGRLLLMPCGRHRADAGSVAVAYLPLLIVLLFFLFGGSQWYFKLFAVCCLLPAVPTGLGLRQSAKHNAKKKLTWWRWAIPGILLLSVLWKGGRLLAFLF